jgi:hypothetical protein
VAKHSISSAADERVLRLAAARRTSLRALPSSRTPSAGPASRKVHGTLGTFGCRAARTVGYDEHVRVTVAALTLAVAGCSFAGTVTYQRHGDRVECKADIGVPILDTGIAVAGLVIGTVMYHAIDEDSWFVELDRAKAITPLTIGALAAVAAVHGFSEVGSCRDRNRLVRAHQHATEQAARARAASRDTAWQRTQQAASAARAGDCTTAVAADGEVRALDGEFHASVFVRDVAIAHCLAASR